MPEVARPVLTARALNRALLQRQGLLERGDAAPVAMVERLVGMQAQVPSNPYVALWSRLERFRPEQLSELIVDRTLVRTGLMRSTIHLVSARDALALSPLVAPLRARTFRSPFAAGLNGVDVAEVVAAGRQLVAERPRTLVEMRDLLAPRFPAAEPTSLSQAVAFHLALVQIPPRGLWRQSMRPTWALTEQWLGAALASAPSLDDYVLRYLAAFGPASPADVRTWCGVSGLRDVIARLRPQLRVFCDEQGKELLDVPDSPLPDPDTPAPPRFLPEYDNVALSHADRSRVFNGLGPGPPWPTGTWIGSLYVDGFFRAFWTITDGTLAIDRFVPARTDPRGTRTQIVAEGERLLELIAPEAASHRVTFGGVAG